MHRHTHLQKKQKDIVKTCFICCLYIILHSGCLKSAILRIDEEKLIFIVSFIKGLISESSLYRKKYIRKQAYLELVKVVERRNGED